ncbi:MAG: hypothetical protein ACLRWH_11035 [Emergencia sp.]
MTTKTETANRNYQDTLFRKLFSTKEKLIELYNALENTNYGPDTPVKITTLEDVLYIGRKNDLGFTIADKHVILAEHQSSINPNMPLRHLVYIGRTFEHLISGLNIYGNTLQKLPTPEFFILYTGNENWQIKTLRLSDAFLSTPSENSMELVVKFINLKYNKDNEILKRSETLEGYSRLIYYIKNGLAKGSPLIESIDEAIARCIREGCLSDFLIKHSREVENMLFEEITWEQVAELRAKEAAEKSFAEGLSKGMSEGLSKGISALIETCRDLGLSKEATSARLKNQFNLTEESLDKYMSEFWK